MNVDIAVVGGGPGGYVAALYAASHGKKVCLIEKRDLGGTCLNRGCIPTKVLVQSAHVFQECKNAKDFGILTAKPEADWPAVLKRKERVVKKLTMGVAALLKARGAEVISGTAVLCGPHALEVDSGDKKETIEAEAIILSTGSEAVRPPIKGADLPDVGCSDEALSYSAIPGTLAVVGGGVVGLELAAVYQMLGTKVTVLEMLPELLPRWDSSLREEMVRSLKRMGMKIITGAKVQEFLPAEQGVICRYEAEGKPVDLPADKVLLSAGRKPVAPLLRGIRLETTERGFVKVDEKFRTSVPSVYAIGDMNGLAMLAHAASHQAVAAVSDILGEELPEVSAPVPSVIYLAESLASVGLTEEEAREKYGDELLVGTFPLSASGMALVHGENRGFVKVIADRKYREILGVHVAAENAAELIAEASALMASEATLDHLTRVLHPHPSMSEALGEAGFAALGTPIHTM